MSLADDMTKLGKKARVAAATMAKATTAQKDMALMAIAETIRARAAGLLTVNGADVDRAAGAGFDDAFVNRLTLTPKTIELMAEGLEQVAKLPDPIGEVTDCCYRPSGIEVGKMRVPLGVIAIIYESRPNVTADAAALCIKSGNATILRGGSEAIETNRAIADCVVEGLISAGLPPEAVQLVSTTDREAVGQLIAMPDYVDVIVPRGGKGLIERVSRDAKVPVIKHLDGICHVFIDVDANLDKAVAICDNAKTQRYGTCNTMETLLIHGNCSPDGWIRLEEIYREKEVELRVCEKMMAWIKNSGREGFEGVKLATDADWSTEYLAPILNVKIVESLDEAIDHINRYGSQHTDAIVTENITTARRFLREVDSASVMVNASTRFADGFEYGLGAEIGISTDKLHARGPVGLEGLTSQKWIVHGDGHVRR